MTDLIVLLGLFGIVSGLTCLIIFAVGGRIARRGQSWTFLICGAIVPVTIFSIAQLQMALAPQGPPPNDGPAMVYMAIILLGLAAIPVSFFTSALAVYKFNCFR